MNIFSLLSYINKVSLLAFFVTTLLVGYQIYVLKKEKTKEQAPSIPDFKDKVKSNEAVNYTHLPGFLIQKDNKQANYSKLVFLIISLLTVMVVIFVFVLIKKKSSLRNKASVSPAIVVSPAPTFRPIVTLLPSLKAPTPSLTDAPMSLLPVVSSSPSPTEIILAKAPSITLTIDPTNNQEVANSKPQVLPETGNIGKGLLIIGVAVSTIFFSFWF